MKIKIKKDASTIYVRRFKLQMVPNQKWVKMLEQIEGMTIEVETDCLFKDQFNTVPIPNVSESGMRIEQGLVEEVIDDIRPGKMKCNMCGHISDKASLCERCDASSKYLEEF